MEEITTMTAFVCLENSYYAMFNYQKGLPRSNFAESLLW